MDLADRMNQCRANIEAMQQEIQEHVQNSENVLILPELATRNGIKPASFRINQNRLLHGHYGKVYSLQWCPSYQHFLVSASQDGNLIVWNGLTGNKIAAIPLRSSWVMTCAYSHTGAAVACGGLENICYIYRLREVNGGNQPDGRINPSVELAGHEGYLSCCRFIGDDQILTSSGDSTCILWDINRRHQIQTFQGHYGDVMAISLADNNNTFISGSVDASVKLWDIRQKGNQSVKTFRGHGADVNAVQFFPDSQAFASGSDDSSARMFDTRSISQVNIFSAQPGVSATSVAFSGTGRILFSGFDDQTCVAWDTIVGTQIGQLSHDNRVSCLGLNSDGKALCTGSWDSFLRVWG